MAYLSKNPTPYALLAFVYIYKTIGRLLYALQGNTPADSSIHPAKKFVYWEGKIHKNDFSDFQYGVDEYIRNYFGACGYKLIDATQLEQEMKEQLTNPINSVIVFADNRFPVKY